MADRGEGQALVAERRGEDLPGMAVAFAQALPVRLGELADMVAAGPPPLPDLAALAERYGLRFGQPDWLPELISRYHLAPPPGA